MATRWAINLGVLIGVSLVASVLVPAFVEESPSLATDETDDPVWLSYVNEYRTMAGLPHLTANKDWADGIEHHARYLVKNIEAGQTIDPHTEDPTNPWYTPEGLAAAQASNLVSGEKFGNNPSHEFFINEWMMAPFHALGILDPRLTETAYGSYFEQGGTAEFAAGLDVIRGRISVVPEDVVFPIFWPSDGAVVPLNFFNGESPVDPLFSCPGFSHPSGLPIIVQMGDGGLSPKLDAHSLKQDGVAVEHCAFDENTFSNPNAELQAQGRNSLALRDAVLLMPRDPLMPGSTYDVSISVSGQTYTWSFKVDLGPATVGLVSSQGVWNLVKGLHDHGRVGNEIGNLASFFYGNPGDFPIAGDWDCNGTETPGLYRQSDGFVYLRNSNTEGVADTAFFFGIQDDIPVAGDFNGDGCDTVSIYRPSEGKVYIIDHLGTAVADYSYYFGNPGDKPFAGDFDGDGIDTIGLHRESTGLVYFRNTHTQGGADHQFYFGIPGDLLIAADWNGDGIDTPAVYRPSWSKFFFRYTNTQGFADRVFSWNGLDPVPVAGVFGLPGYSSLTSLRE